VKGESKRGSKRIKKNLKTNQSDVILSQNGFLKNNFVASKKRNLCLPVASYYTAAVLSVVSLP
jgi:hypothetical protein